MPGAGVGLFEVEEHAGTCRNPVERNRQRLVLTVRPVAPNPPVVTLPTRQRGGQRQVVRDHGAGGRKLHVELEDGCPGVLQRGTSGGRDRGAVGDRERRLRHYRRTTGRPADSQASIPPATLTMEKPAPESASATTAERPPT